MPLKLATSLSKYTLHNHAKVKAMVSLDKSNFFMLAYPQDFSISVMLPK